MTENEAKYYDDIRGRKNFPKGTISIVEEVKHNKDLFTFTANPSPRSQSYAVVEYKKGKYTVVLYENLSNRKVLLRTGVRTNENEVNPSYPLLAWDGKGSRLAWSTGMKGKIKLFVYDMVANIQTYKQRNHPFRADPGYEIHAQSKHTAVQCSQERTVRHFCI